MFHSGNPARRFLAGLLAFATLGPVGAAERAQPELRVLAAASLTDVLGELSEHWQRSSGVCVRVSFAASSVLARQIEAGGAADVFVSADREWMDYLAARHLLDGPSRRDVAGNRLVLIAPADRGMKLEIAPGFALAAALGDGRLSIGDPDIVPAGRYARSALRALGVWDDVARRLAPADNVRAALVYVARAETPLGIVYETDALLDSSVRIVDTFPADTHAPINYPAAAMRAAPRAAVEFVDYLAGSAARDTWKKFGFTEPAR